MHRTVIHLINSESLVGLEVDPTEEDVEEVQDAVETLLSSSGSWQITMVKNDGNIAIVPKPSVLYVEIQKS